MRKLFATAAALFAFQAYAGGGSIVVCESMTPCRMPPPYQDYDTPTLTFDTTTGGLVNITAALWLSFDCPGDPNDSMYLPDEPIPGEGHWYLTLSSWAIYPDGTDYSIRWTIDGCPATACTNGTTGSSPAICQ